MRIDSNSAGYTLVEMLIALAVGSIVVGGAYASYSIVANQYNKIKDVSEMHTSGRNIMRMIERDIRMAGFEYRDAKANVVYGSISEPLIIKDSGNKCCDEVTVTYDYHDNTNNKTERVRIRYWAENYTGAKGTRGRLYRKRDILMPKTTNGGRDVLADYIEDFQLYQDESSGLDQSQTVYNAATSARTIDNRSYWQSFTAGKTGVLSKIKVGFVGGNWNGSMLLRIYEGAREKNKILSSYNVNVNATKKRITVNEWNVSTPVVSGKKYAFDFKPIKGVPDPYGLAVASRAKGSMGECVNGTCYNVNNFDMYFQTYVGKGESSLVEINLTLRTKNQYGKDRQFKKKDYHGGNYKIDKTDKYKRDTFFSTVLVRNLAL